MSKLRFVPGLLIRRARIDESPTIASILHHAFAEYEPLYTPAAFTATTPTSDQIQKRWKEGPVWVAVQNVNFVGTVAAVPKHEGLYIRSMAVLPRTRGQGIAEQLLRVTESYAVAAQHRLLFLSTTPFLTSAIRLYERFGFRASDEGPHDLFGTSLFTMVKPLQPMSHVPQNRANHLMPDQENEQYDRSG
jgi:ribosomal protein S18 acetylase RimI-like enzyme